MMKKLRVTVDGKPYDVTVEVPDDSEAALPQAPPPVSLPSPSQKPSLPPAPVATSSPTKENTGPGDVPSPLAGRVINIVVKPGQEVKENDHLLTLEAMKMNTFVFSPKAGHVAEIKVSVGDAVNEGQALARIE